MGSTFTPHMSLLFMEFMPNGDLFQAIHNDQTSHIVSWDNRGKCINVLPVNRIYFS